MYIGGVLLFLRRGFTLFTLHFILSTAVRNEAEA